ncbi:MAG: hypothetical protein KF754_04510 [Planctomycetes bacterium]|nr:hypothetical protein [Planctomycetota bacterium]
MIRHALTLLLVASTFACAASADMISYLRRAGGKVTIESVDNVTVTAWNARQVSYRTADNKTGTVTSADVISLVRAGGSMSRELEAAIAEMANDPQAAEKALQDLTNKGNDLDKEEALFRKAELWAGEARTSGKTSAYTQAITDFGTYTNRFKAGYFARDAYTSMADFQRKLKRVADARTTLRAMINADAALQRLGNQKLGELEASQGDWKAALTAFKAAEGGSGDDKNARYLALAWQGVATLKNGDAAAARTILETVTNDETFQDEGNEDELALAVAYPALGDAYYAAGNFTKAYDAYVLAGYYIWWSGLENEGYVLAQAYLCAKKLQGTDEKWKARTEKLRTALAVSYPRDLQRADSEK